MVKAIMSPRLKSIYKGLLYGDNRTLDEFWEEIDTHGAPFIEEIEGDDKNVFMTFIYRAKSQVNNVIVYGSFPSYRYNENKMERLLDSDLWFRTYKVRNDIKFTYCYSVNDHLDDDYKKRSRNLILDDLNPNKITFPKDDEKLDDRDIHKSFMQLYKESDNDLWRDNSSEKGTMELIRFESKILNNTRRVWIYNPYKYHGKNSKNNLVVLTDGFIHTYILNAKNLLDNLISKKLIPDSVIAFVDNGKDRYEELTCNEKFSDFIGKELVPWVYENYRVYRDPKKSIIGGLSLGGLSAAHIGLSFPNIFGKVLAQSGSFWWKDEWIIERYKSMEKLPLEFYLNVGVLEARPYDDEPVMKECIDRMRNILLSKGYTVFYEEFPSGHDYLCWEEKLASGLMKLMK